jgi:glucosamine--fructose-6-phosphate aminotransferase (isomerizing)
VPATKTYTTALAVVHQLAAAWAERPAMAEQIHRVPEWIASVFALEPEIEDRSERYRYMDHCAVLARGLNYCTAQETALKLQECCYVVPEALSSADLMHGPVASLEPGFPCFLFAPGGKALASLQELSAALSGRQAEQIIVSDLPEMVARGTVGFRLPGPLPEELSPLVAVVVGQLLAFYLAKHKGLDPDEPRGLRKVTLTR